MKHYVPIYLTFDLEGWPWPSPFTTQNVQLHEIHMQAIYQVAFFNVAKVYIKWAILTTYIWPLPLKDDLDLSPLKMCSSMRYICMPNIKLLSSILQKLLQMLKLAQTNRPTNQQTGQKQYVPHYSGGGHKKYHPTWYSNPRPQVQLSGALPTELAGLKHSVPQYVLIKNQTISNSFVIFWLVNFCNGKYRWTSSQCFCGAFILIPFDGSYFVCECRIWMQSGQMHLRTTFFGIRILCYRWGELQKAIAPKTIKDVKTIVVIWKQQSF